MTKDDLNSLVQQHTVAGDALSALWKETYGAGRTPHGNEATEFKRLKDEYARLDTEIHHLAARLGVKLEASSVVHRPARKPSRTRH